MMKESTLQAIGYICQDVDPLFMQESANEILTAIVHGMRRDETSNQVKLASTNALLNSLEFTRANFERDAERHFIMQVGCEAIFHFHFYLSTFTFYFHLCRWCARRRRARTSR